MKVRESGMPDEACWDGFFDPEAAVGRLLGEDVAGDVVEFGCGYGTFTVAAARRIAGLVTALDIDPDMVAIVDRKVGRLGLTNVRTDVRDFVADGTGLEAGSQAHAMIYNLLHLEDPIGLLREAHRVLRRRGRLSVIHWRSDIPTPRGPPLNMRPTPDQCRRWMAEAGFRTVETVDLRPCCPYHFGLIAER